MEQARRMVFVVGTGRCGSTMFSDLLALHPEFGFVSNVDNRLHVGSRGVAQKIYRYAGSRVSTRRAVPHPSEGYGALGREVSPILVDPPRDLLATDATPYISARLERFFGDRAHRQNVDWFIHKFTGWPRARLLATVFPEASFIHVVRDGRAVANSLIQQAWWRGVDAPGSARRQGFGSTDPLRPIGEFPDRFEIVAACQWKNLIQEFVKCEDEIGGDRWITLRYEDIVEHPEESVTATLAYLGLPMPTQYRTAVRRINILPSRVDGYKEELPKESIVAMDRILRDELRRFGYE